MAQKKPKLDVSQDRKPLENTPFAALLGAGASAAVEAPPQAAASGEKSQAPRPYFSISRTRKGGYPIHIEKRGGGKCVTVVSGLSGDVPALLKNLRKMCGGGGALREDGLEIQGDHREKLETFFKENG